MRIWEKMVDLIIFFFKVLLWGNWNNLSLCYFCICEVVHLTCAMTWNTQCHWDRKSNWETCDFKEEFYWTAADVLYTSAVSDKRNYSTCFLILALGGGVNSEGTEHGASNHESGIYFKIKMRNAMFHRCCLSFSTIPLNLKFLSHCNAVWQDVSTRTECWSD